MADEMRIDSGKVLHRDNLFRTLTAALMIALVWVVASELLASGFLNFNLGRFGGNCALVLSATLINILLFYKVQSVLQKMSRLRALVVIYLMVTVVACGVQFIVEPPQTSAAGIDIVITNVVICSAIVAIVTKWFTSVERQHRQQRAEANAKVQALQSRIRPHFLFNSMNTIASLIAVDPDRAETAVEDLSELFRGALADTATEVTLEKELGMCRRYLDIEGLRMGKRLKLEWHIDEVCLPQMLPALSVQPLLENAIYHGIQPLTEGGTIEVSAVRRGEQVIVAIANPSADEVQSSHKGNRMALNNIKQRLDALYGRAGELVARQESDRYVVELKIPFREGEL